MWEKSALYTNKYGIYESGPKSSYDDVISAVVFFLPMGSKHCNTDRRSVLTTNKDKPYLITFHEKILVGLWTLLPILLIYTYVHTYIYIYIYIYIYSKQFMYVSLRNTVPWWYQCFYLGRNGGFQITFYKYLDYLDNFNDVKLSGSVKYIGYISTDG